MTKLKSFVSRRRLIGASLMIPVLVLAIWQVSTRSTSAQGGGGFESAIFTVSPRTGTFTTSTSPGSTFQFIGDITFVNERGESLPGDDGTLGTFYRSGVVQSDGTLFVNDIYVLRSSNAYITASGFLKAVSAIEGADLLVVTGGVGTFRSATGEAQLTTTGANGQFTVRLEDTLRRLGQFGGQH